jgi:hypothetical protein
MLSFMTRGLPATRHVARTLDTWQRQTVDDTWQTARHVVDTWHEAPVAHQVIVAPWWTSRARADRVECAGRHTRPEWKAI